MPKTQAILLTGPTGSGKTPLGDLLDAEGLWGRRCCHFDFGAQLRRVAASSEPPGRLSEADAAFVREVLNSGALLENEHFRIARTILEDFIGRRAVDSDGLVVLNGLPRHIGQAEDIGALVDVRTVISLVCPADVGIERIRVNTGGDRTGRSDDDRASVERKIELFARRTAPLLEFYRAVPVSVITVDVAVDTTPRDVLSGLARCI